MLVVLECLKDAFHIDTVYVNSFDPSRGCTLQAELIVTTLSGSDSSAMGECGGRGITSFIMVSRVFSLIHSLFDAIFSQDEAKEGR